MISKILKSTKGKPCSCPEGKICQGCKKKKIVKPLVYIEEPRRLPVPIVISHNREKPATTVEYPKRLSLRKHGSTKKTSLYQWYKRRKALKQLESEYQKKKRLDNQVHQERLERIWLERESEAENREVKENKSPKRSRARTTATAKPRAESKCVTVKQYNRYEAISNRFVNCCYRLCCQFYCYLSIIFIIGFAIVYFL